MLARPPSSGATPERSTTCGPSCSDGAGHYKIWNVNSNLLLGVTNMSTTSGAQVLQWSDNGTADHLWTLASA